MKGTLCALDRLPDFRTLVIKTVKPLCGLTAHFDIMEKTTEAWTRERYACPPY